jgi:hypothetical protein
MQRPPLRAILILLIALVAAGTFISAKSPLQNVFGNSTSSPCQASGVSLVIDYGETSGKPLEVRCVQDFEGTGWQLFESASVAVAGTSEYPNSFVCRINNFPGAESEDCLGTPSPSEGSWVYYFANEETNFQWNRSGQGAAAREPKCGDYEGWKFSGSTQELATPPNFKPKRLLCK